MRKISFIVASVTLVVLAGTILLFFSIRPAAEKPANVTVAYAPFESTALLWIAEDRQYFSRRSINVKFRKYDAGAKALDVMLNGEADIAAGIAEFPLVIRVLTKKSPRVFGNIDKGDFIYLVGRKDRIKSPADLKGKKIGTTLGTVAQFHLGRFLNLNDMNIEDIVLVDLKTPEEWVNAVADGEIDAVVTAQPYADSAMERLGENAVAWPVQSQQPVFALVVSNPEWIAKHPDLVKRFLNALADAEEYLISHPVASKAIVRKRLNLDKAYMDTVWSQNRFSLSLEQSFVLAMEDEARWMMSNGLTTEKEIPDFLDYVYESGLKEIKPEAVSVIRGGQQ
jgi:NitT/TauT family transport system substrate-binding protein